MSPKSHITGMYTGIKKKQLNFKFTAFWLLTGLNKQNPVSLLILYMSISTGSHFLLKSSVGQTLNRTTFRSVFLSLESLCFGLFFCKYVNLLRAGSHLNVVYLLPFIQRSWRNSGWRYKVFFTLSKLSEKLIFTDNPKCEVPPSVFQGFRVEQAHCLWHHCCA